VRAALIVPAVLVLASTHFAGTVVDDGQVVAWNMLLAIGRKVRHPFFLIRSTIVMMVLI
jgi:hypothetical protein